MELTHKTTILFSERQYEYLMQLAESRQTSLGSLVREACERQYGLASTEESLQAVRSLTRLALPVADTAAMKRESVLAEKDLAP